MDNPQDGLAPSWCPPVSIPGAGQPRHLWDWKEAGGRGQEAGRRQPGGRGKAGRLRLGDSPAGPCHTHCSTVLNCLSWHCCSQVHCTTLCVHFTALLCALYYNLACTLLHCCVHCTIEYTVLQCCGHCTALLCALNGIVECTVWHCCVHCAALMCALYGIVVCIVMHCCAMS